MYRPTTSTTLSVLFLSALAAPMPFGDSLDKRWKPFAGTGRLYYPQVDHLACGPNADSYPIVAVSNFVYSAEDICNRGIIVTNNANKNVAYARIRDECQQPVCVDYDLDLSDKLFVQLGGTPGANMNISWYPVAW